MFSSIYGIKSIKLVLFLPSIFNTIFLYNHVVLEFSLTEDFHYEFFLFNKCKIIQIINFFFSDFGCLWLSKNLSIPFHINCSIYVQRVICCIPSLLFFLISVESLMSALVSFLILLICVYSLFFFEQARILPILFTLSKNQLSVLMIFFYYFPSLISLLSDLALTYFWWVFFLLDLYG